jgi:hypothetical protein
METPSISEEYRAAALKHLKRLKWFLNAAPALAVAAAVDHFLFPLWFWLWVAASVISLLLAGNEYLLYRINKNTADVLE